jgi:hypothetical protein
VSVGEIGGLGPALDGEDAVSDAVSDAGSLGGVRVRSKIINEPCGDRNRGLGRGPGGPSGERFGSLPVERFDSLPQECPGYSHRPNGR